MQGLSWAKPHSYCLAWLSSATLKIFISGVSSWIFDAVKSKFGLLKNLDNLKNDDDIKNEDDLKNKEDLKN